jgi:ferredoxin
MPIVIKKDECEGCGTCMTVCSRSAISLVETDGKLVAEIEPSECEECGECVGYCMRGAIKKE